MSWLDFFRRRRRSSQGAALGYQMTGEERVETTGMQALEGANWFSSGVGANIAYELGRPKAVGVDFYKKARLIRRDPTIKLVREFAIAPILAAEWGYESSDDAPIGAKDFVAEQMDQLRLSLLKASMLGCIDYGWQAFEKIWYDCPDGAWGILALKPLLHDITTILVDPSDGSYAGVRQTQLTTPPGVNRELIVDLLEDEAVLINIDVEGTQWYGEPVLKSLEGVYEEVAGVTKAARRYDTKVAGSHWVVYYPLGTSNYNGIKTDNGEIARQLIANIEAVGGIAVPRSVIQIIDSMQRQAVAGTGVDALMWKIELLSDSGSGQMSFTDRFKYLDVLKVRAFGYPERALLEGQFGTKAEADSHGDLATVNIENKHRGYTQQYDEQIVDSMLSVNYGEEAEGTVWIEPAPLQETSKAFLQELYKLLFANPQGFMQELQAIDVSGIRDQLGIPETEANYQDDLAQLDGFNQQLEEPLPGVDPVAGPTVAQPYGEGAAA